MRIRTGGAIAATTAALTAAAIALAGCGSTSHNSASDPPARLAVAADPTSPTVSVISVAGQGQVSGTPDTATVTMGVSTNDASAQNAMNKNAQEATALINTLKGKGVADKDIQTTELSVNPNFDNKGNITGYNVSNTVTVTMHDLKNAGSIIDAAAAAVGNDVRLQNVALSISNTSPLLAQARAAAVKDAMAQGQQLATAAGVKLGAILTIDDTGTEQPTPLEFSGASAGGALRDAAVPTPVQSGSQQLSVNVNVKFEIAS
jgi:uncharacterized protein YggE